MAKTAVLALLDSSKVISRKNLNDRKIVTFPHCGIPNVKSPFFLNFSLITNLAPKYCQKLVTL